MKPTAVLFWLFICLNAWAQDSTKQHVVKLNIFGPILGQYQLVYERVLGKSSAQISAGATSRQTETQFDESSFRKNTGGFLLIPEFRYFFKTAPKGPYGGIFARFKHESEKLEDTTDSLVIDVSYKGATSTLGGGVMVGWQWIAGDAITFDLFGGLQYKAQSIKRNYKDPDVTDEDFRRKFPDLNTRENILGGIRFGFNMGVAF